MDNGSFIRLYNADGKHVASLVKVLALCDEIDLTDPDGNVFYCGVPEDLANELGKLLTIESI